MKFKAQHWLKTLLTIDNWSKDVLTKNSRIFYLNLCCFLPVPSYILDQLFAFTSLNSWNLQLITLAGIQKECCVKNKTVVPEMYEQQAGFLHVNLHAVHFITKVFVFWYPWLARLRGGWLMALPAVRMSWTGNSMQTCQKGKRLSFSGTRSSPINNAAKCSDLC